MAYSHELGNIGEVLGGLQSPIVLTPSSKEARHGIELSSDISARTWDATGCWRILRGAPCRDNSVVT